MAVSSRSLGDPRLGRIPPPPAARPHELSPMLSKPRRRATSSIKSSSMLKSKRCGGRCTRQPAGGALHPIAHRRQHRLQPRHRERPRRAISRDACGASSPTSETRQRRRPPRGSPAPAPVRRPTMSISSAVARSMAMAGRLGSTPRSNRCAASVNRPRRRARPAIASGAKCADSSSTS